MQGTAVRFELRRSRDVSEREVGVVSKIGVLGLWQAGISEEEKDYQRLVAEKLRAVAEHDFRESKQLALG